jgi:hypothetical protein
VRDILEILFIAVGSAFWPLLLVVVVLALNTNHPVKILFWFWIGGMLTTITVGTAMVKAFKGSSFVSGSKPPADPWIDITIGVLALLAGFVLQLGTKGRGPKRLRVRTKPAKGSKTSARIEALVERGAPLAFVAGIVATILPGPLPIIGMKNIAELDYATAETFTLIVVFYVVMFAFVEIPLAACVVAPAWAKRTTLAFNAWLANNLRRLAIGALYIVGGFELVRGIVASFR